MMKLYIVIYNVDMGYHIHKIFNNEADANHECEAVNRSYNHEFTGHHGDKFEVIIHKVEA